MCHLSAEFFENSLSSFLSLEILLTNKQTNANENVTFLTLKEVIAKVRRFDLFYSKDQTFLFYVRSTYFYSKIVGLA